MSEADRGKERKGTGEPSAWLRITQSNAATESPSAGGTETAHARRGTSVGGRASGDGDRPRCRNPGAVRASVPGRPSVANVSQVVTLDRSQLVERSGRLPAAKLQLVLSGIDVILGR